MARQGGPQPWQSCSEVALVSPGKYGGVTWCVAGPLPGSAWPGAGSGAGMARKAPELASPPGTAARTRLMGHTVTRTHLMGSGLGAGMGTSFDFPRGDMAWMRAAARRCRQAGTDCCGCTTETSSVPTTAPSAQTGASLVSWRSQVEQLCGADGWSVGHGTHHSIPRGVRGDGEILGHIPPGQESMVEGDSGERERKSQEGPCGLSRGSRAWQGEGRRGGTGA